MSGFDSEAVLALKARIAALDREPYSDWGKKHRRFLTGQIRSQRLAEARQLGTHTPEQWEAILTEFGGRCVCCGCLPDPRPCKDHIVPISMGGSDGIDNLQPLCRECNTSRGGDCFNRAAHRRQFGWEA